MQEHTPSNTVTTALPTTTSFDALDARCWGSRLRRALRGRQLKAMLLCLVGASLAGAIAFTSVQPLYRSEAVVRVNPAMPQVLQQTDQNGPMPMFEAFLQSQQTLITSGSMIQAAMASRAWGHTGRGCSEDAQRDFARSLSVDARNGTDCLRIGFIDRDPAIAAAAVNALLGVYQEAYNAQQTRLDEQRCRLLRERVTALIADQQRIAAELQKLVDGLDAVDLDMACAAGEQRLEKLEAELTVARLAAGSGKLPSPAANDLTPQQIAAVDPMMQKYLLAQERREDELAAAELRYGEMHPTIASMRGLLQIAQARVDQRRQEYLSEHQAASVASNASGAVKTGQEGADAEQLAQICAAARKELADLGAKRLQQQRLQSELEENRKELGEVTHRLAVVQAEADLGGRLSVVKPGEAALMPFQDLRYRMAGMAILCGGILTLLILLGPELRRPRYRSAQDAADDLASSAGLFAVLPELHDDPNRMISPAAVAAAAAIHHLRLRLAGAGSGQVGSAQAGRVLLVTSPCTGDGRTNVALALGISFAAAGVRTLVVDFDPSPRSISSRFEPQCTGGLKEALATGEAGENVRKLRFGLGLLSVGASDTLETCNLSAAAARRLLEAARREFEVIVLDAGPLHSSLSASLLAPVSDGTILVVSQNQEQKQALSCLEQLRALHGELAGVVFNRAGPRDVQAWTGVLPARADDVAADVPGRMGPLPAAVLRSVRLTRSDDLRLRGSDELVAATAA